MTARGIWYRKLPPPLTATPEPLNAPDFKPNGSATCHLGDFEQTGVLIEKDDGAKHNRKMFTTMCVAYSECSGTIAC